MAEGRRPSSWTRLNHERVAAPDAQGRMTEAGREALAIAKANGWWVITAAKPETRAMRIAKIVTEAEQGRRAAG